MQVVQGAGDPLVEHEGIDPAQQIRLALAKADMAARYPDHELRREVGLRVPLGDLGKGEVGGCEHVHLAGELRGDGRRFVVEAYDLCLRRVFLGQLGYADVLGRAAWDTDAVGPEVERRADRQVLRSKDPEIETGIGG